MKRSKKEEIEDVEETMEEEEVDEKEEKKRVREEKKERRLKKKKQDKAARWAGAVMLFLIMITGFLLWVSGQIVGGPRESVQPVVTPPSRFAPSTDAYPRLDSSPAGKVILR